MAKSRTGTGKTLAFGIPLLERLAESPRDTRDGWRPATAAGSAAWLTRVARRSSARSGDGADPGAGATDSRRPAGCGQGAGASHRHGTRRRSLPAPRNGAAARHGRACCHPRSVPRLAERAPSPTPSQWPLQAGRWTICSGVRWRSTDSSNLFWTKQTGCWTWASPKRWSFCSMGLTPARSRRCYSQQRSRPGSGASPVRTW